MSELESRLPIWLAISEFYLDTELEEGDYQWIYETLKTSGKSLKDLKEIDTYEVFPALQANLNNIAGEWGAFDEDWLTEVCTKNYYRRSKPSFRLFTWLRNKGAYWMRADHWKKIEKMFQEQSSNHEDRNAH